jgi:transcriptional regulator with XRE-family HTH domain
MNIDIRSTIRSRELGDALRQAMEAAGLTGRRAAGLLGWSESRVSRVLTGRVGATEVDISAFLAVCGVIGDARERLMRLAREQDTPGWLQQHSSRLPEQLQTLIDHENKAVEIIDFQPIIVPGLLQTGDYARELIASNANVDPDEVRGRLAAKLLRQKLFSRLRRPRFTFFIHEFALRLPVGGDEIMSEQLHTLLRLSVRSYISIRVIPVAAGAYTGVSGGCRLMEFVEFRPVVYVEEETAGLFLEKPEEICAYRNIFSSLAQVALDEGESKELIAGLAIALYADGGDDHDPA